MLDLKTFSFSMWTTVGKYTRSYLGSLDILVCRTMDQSKTKTNRFTCEGHYKMRYGMRFWGQLKSIESFDDKKSGDAEGE